MAEMFYAPQASNNDNTIQNFTQATNGFADTAVQIRNQLNLKKQTALDEAEQRRQAFFANAEKFGFAGNIPGYINTPMGKSEYVDMQNSATAAINADKLLNGLFGKNQKPGEQMAAEATDIRNLSTGSIAAGSELDQMQRALLGGQSANQAMDQPVQQVQQPQGFAQTALNPQDFTQVQTPAQAQTSSMGPTPVLQTKPAFNSMAAFPDKTGNAQAFTQNQPTFSPTPAQAKPALTPEQQKAEALKTRFSTLEAAKDPVEQKRIYRTYEYADKVTSKPGDTHITQNSDGTFQVRNLNGQSFPTKEAALQALVENRSITFAPGERAVMAGIKTPEDMPSAIKKLREAADKMASTATTAPVTTPAAPMTTPSTSAPVASTTAPVKGQIADTALDAEFRSQLNAFGAANIPGYQNAAGTFKGGKTTTELWLNAPQSFQDKWKAEHGDALPPGVSLTKTPYAQKALDAAMTKTAESATVVSQKGADILANVEQEKPITNQQALTMQQALIQTKGNYQKALSALTPETAKAIHDSAVNKVMNMNSEELQLNGMTEAATRRGTLENLSAQVRIQEMQTIAANSGANGIALKDALDTYQKLLQTHNENQKDLMLKGGYKSPADLMKNNAIFADQDEKLRQMRDALFSAMGISADAKEFETKTDHILWFKYNPTIVETDPLANVRKSAAQGTVQGSSRVNDFVNTKL